MVGCRSYRQDEAAASEWPDLPFDDGNVGEAAEPTHWADAVMQEADRVEQVLQDNGLQPAPELLPVEPATSGMIREVSYVQQLDFLPQRRKCSVVKAAVPKRRISERPSGPDRENQCRTPQQRMEIRQNRAVIGD